MLIISPITDFAVLSVLSRVDWFNFRQVRQYYIRLFPVFLIVDIPFFTRPLFTVYVENIFIAPEKGSDVLSFSDMYSNVSIEL